MLLIGGCSWSLFVAWCVLLIVIGCVLFVDCLFYVVCSLFVMCRCLMCVCCMFVVRCSLSVAGWMLFGVCCVLLLVACACVHVRVCGAVRV